ncbi:hypothetical protein [Phyllobacterium phragmitis]|uniref:hypothetical protein n=1 Tax=Phyllobacterium phragmitis TaxID=2670329 RepID=UPI0011B1E4A8
MTAIPFAIASTVVQLAASVSRVRTTSGGLEIRGSVAVQTAEGLSFGGVRKRTERAALPAVAGMPDAHRHGPSKGPRGDGLRLVQAHALAADRRQTVLSAVRDAAVGIVPQEAMLLNDTLKMNIALGRPINEERLRAAAAKAAILERIEAMPQGFARFMK